LIAFIGPFFVSGVLLIYEFLIEISHWDFRLPSRQEMSNSQKKTSGEQEAKTAIENPIATVS
jgi:hypothetical protein